MGAVGVVQASCAVAALLAAPVLVALARGAPDRVPTAIQDRAATDGSTLQLGLASCNGHPDITRVEETPTQVRLLVVADEPGRDRDDCSDGLQVRLRAPLGGRAVVDASTGQPVPARPRAR